MSISYNKDGTPRKPGSGRTKGAVSLVPVRLGDLLSFLGEDAQIIMGRKFLESIGFMNNKRGEDFNENYDLPHINIKEYDHKKNKWIRK
jgi:hypothetical protein